MQAAGTSCCPLTLTLALTLALTLTRALTLTLALTLALPLLGLAGTPSTRA